LILARRIVLLAALAAATSSAALGIAGVHVDDQATVGGHGLVLNGAGVRKRLVFRIYVGSLYVPDKAATAQAILAQSPRRIQLSVLRDISADQLIGALLDGLKENTTASEMQAISIATGEMAAIMKSFGHAKEGSVVTLDFVDGATTIGLDGESRGTIDGEAFNAALTRIWIGDHPVQADLKKAMLGGA
jgi:long-chain acyl-CoA synthetase